MQMYTYSWDYEIKNAYYSSLCYDCTGFNHIGIVDNSYLLANNQYSMQSSITILNENMKFT